MSKKKLSSSAPRKVRGPNKPKPITEERQTVSRMEASRITGYHPDSLKRLERRRGGVLDVVKLRGPNSNTFYYIEQVRALIKASTVPVAEKDNSAPNVAA
jgi:hypothetical protein